MVVMDHLSISLGRAGIRIYEIMVILHLVTGIMAAKDEFMRRLESLNSMFSLKVNHQWGKSFVPVTKLTIEIYK
jgi:hypothetical protein